MISQIIVKDPKDHIRKKKNHQISVYLKIMLNYLQMVSFIKSLNVKWPFYADNYLNSMSFLNSVSTSFVNVECLVYQYNINGEILHLKAVFSSLLPFCLFFIVILIMIFQRMFLRKSNFKKLWLAFFVISAFMHPDIVRSLFYNISCIDIEDRRYLVQQFDLECDSSHHKRWVKNIYYNLIYYIKILA